MVWLRIVRVSWSVESRQLCRSWFVKTSLRPGVWLFASRVPTACESSGIYLISGLAVSWIMMPARHDANSMFRPLAPVVYVFRLTTAFMLTARDLHERTTRLFKHV